MTHLTATEAGHKAGVDVAGGELTVDEAARFALLWDAEAPHHGAAFRKAFLEGYLDPEGVYAPKADTSSSSQR